MVYKFIHILLIMCSLTCRLYTLLHRRHQLYGLWLVHALAVPIGVLVFPLGYLLCFYPVRKIAQKIYEIVASKCYKHRRSVKHVEIQDITIQSTYPKSDRISQPSETYFIMPHPDISENSLLNSADTGYGSTQVLNC